VSAPRIGVIAPPARGGRIHPRSSSVPKVMLEIGGKALLARNVELLRDAFGIRENPHRHRLPRRPDPGLLRDGSAFDVRIRYIENPDVDAGLGTALLVIEPHGPRAVS